jgi:hypothetical protein
MEIVIDTSDRTPRILDSARAQSKISFPLTRLVRGSIAEATDGKDIFACGITVGTDEVASPDFLLPAILFAASEALRLSANAHSGKDGFAFHMRADEKALLMFKVSHLEVSSPRILVSSIMDVLRQSEYGGEYILDDLIARFSDFIRDDLSLEPSTGEKIEISIIMAGT